MLWTKVALALEGLSSGGKVCRAKKSTINVKGINDISFGNIRKLRIKFLAIFDHFLSKKSALIKRK